MYANPSLNLFMEFYRYFAFILTVIVTITLLWMLLVRHTMRFGTYKYLLLAFIVADIFYAVTHFLVVPVPEIYNNCFVMGSHGFWKSKLSQCTWMVAYSFSFPLLSYNFIYRFVAIKYPMRITLFTSPTIITMMATIVFANASIWFCINHFLWFNHKKDNVYIQDLFTIDISSYMSHDMEEINNYVLIVFWENGTFNGFNASGILGGSFLAFVILMAYLTMIITSYQIMQHMDNKPSTNEYRRRLHQQLFRALVYQAVLPLFTAYLPISLCCLLPFFGLPAPIFSVLCPPFCALHPVIDACIMLTTVSQFRKSVVDMIFCPLRAIRKPLHYTIEPSIDQRTVKKLSDVY